MDQLYGDYFVVCLVRAVSGSQTVIHLIICERLKICELIDK